jgi:hypothetical protein
MKRETLLKVVKLCEHADEAEARIIINALNRGAKLRMERRTEEALINIKVGDLVRIRNAKPKYLIGTRATVLSIDHAKAKIKIEFGTNVDPRAIRRWGHTPICDASMLEKI